MKSGRNVWVTPAPTVCGHTAICKNEPLPSHPQVEVQWRSLRIASAAGYNAKEAVWTFNGRIFHRLFY